MDEELSETVQSGGKQKSMTSHTPHPPQSSLQT
jgi:hypothetical protein